MITAGCRIVIECHFAARGLTRIVGFQPEIGLAPRGIRASCFTLMPSVDGGCESSRLRPATAGPPLA
jgi:hypothetical protein